MLKKIQGIYGKVFIPLFFVGAFIINYAYLFWLPKSIDYAIEQSRYQLDKTLHTIAKGLVPLMIEHKLSDIYNTLDIVKENNQDWMDLQLFNNKNEAIYPFNKKNMPKPTDSIKILKHPIKSGDTYLGQIIIVYDVSQLSSDIRENSITLFLMILLAIAVFIFVAASVLHFVILKPISQLTQASNDLSQGNYETKMPTATKDEVGELVNSFKAMTNNIKKAQISMQEQNRELEKHLSKESILKEEANLLEQIIFNSKDGVILADAKDINNGPNILYVNEAFTKITGYSKEEVIGKTPRIFQGPKTDRKILDNLRKCLEKGKPFSGELINYDKKGNEYWLGIDIVPIKDSKGKVTHFAAIERDITGGKKNKEELVKAKEKAEESSKAKSEFLANMSHELRTPMNGILGLCEILIDSKLDNEQKENAKTIYKSGQNLLSILNDVLDISKIESGELEIEKVSFDISTALNEVVQLFIPLAAQKQIELKEEKSNIPDVILGDLGKIQQVLRNLINNALKFTESGSVTVITKKTKLNKNNYIYFAVKDTGIGIPQNKLENIFEKFSQADTSVTRKFGGTGLGLAICKKLTDLMEGDIGVESVEGEGSKFWFMVPLEKPKNGTKPVNLFEEKVSTSSEKLPTKSSILAVDDHPINRMFVEKVLKKLGFENIDIASDGEEALEKIFAKKYDIVLMDCQMPKLDGYQATAILRRKEDEKNSSHTPIIALTANAMVGDREKCIRAGMDDYLIKPIKADKLTSMLKKWLCK